MPVFLQSLLGGVLIGGSAAGLLLVNGRIAGISGILGEATAGRPGLWRWAFLAGLVATGLVAHLAGMSPPAGLTAQGLGVLLVSGLLVGFGTSVGSGCTSGHGVCGVANLSPRSLVATATFMVVAAAVVFLVRHVEPVRTMMAWTHR